MILNTLNPVQVDARLPRARRRLQGLSAAVVVFVVAFVTIDAITGWPSSILELMRERSPIAWLSSVLLSSSALIAALIALREREPAKYWALAIGLFGLSLDERFMGHERLKHAILRHVFDYDRQAMRFWGDLPLTLVPLLGGWWLWRRRSELSSRASRVLIGLAVAIGAIAIMLDVATIERHAQAVEEILEVLSETAFLLAMFELYDRKQGTARGDVTPGV